LVEAALARIAEGQNPEHLSFVTRLRFEQLRLCLNRWHEHSTRWLFRF
jgi:hypothetical protein